jgi:hypothetical protein
MVRWLTIPALTLGFSLWGVGCSSDDSATNPGSDAGDSAVVKDPCDSFTTSGAPCDQVSTRVCFPLCATGGCRCITNPQGTGGIWQCTTDTSCFPDSAPPGDFADAGADAAD